MRQQPLATRFDRISRHPWLPIGAALIISVATFGAYSAFTAGEDVRAPRTAVPDKPEVDSSGVQTSASHDNEGASGSVAPAAAHGATTRPDGETRTQQTP